MNQNTGNAKRFFSNAKLKAVAVAIAASLNGVNVPMATSAILIYDALFERLKRPNYDLYPGLYCYDRIRGSLERNTLMIPSGDCNLQAYYYPARLSRGLAVLAHGFRAGADDYLPLIEAMVNKNYSVLTYDVRGVYSSEGSSTIGMCQSLRDLDNVLTFAKEQKPFSAMPKVVIGHSWGGYAASSVLALHSEIRAAALIAPMNDGSTIMIEKGEQYAGKFAHPPKPIFDAYQKWLFGNYVNYNGVVGINSTSAPILIAQGLNDAVITPNAQSITAHLNEITNPNVTVYWGNGLQGSHTGIWHSVESEQYQREVKRSIKKLESEQNRKLTEDELAKIYASVDHRLYSDVNADLVDRIINTFDRGIG